MGHIFSVANWKTSRESYPNLALEVCFWGLPACLWILLAGFCTDMKERGWFKISATMFGSCILISLCLLVHTTL